MWLPLLLKSTECIAYWSGFGFVLCLPAEQPEQQQTELVFCSCVAYC
jgi:hypothetical protein